MKLLIDANHPILRNILAIFIGLFIGGLLNGYLISISGSIIPFPEGFDNRTMEGLKAGMAVMEPKHFIFPFLAHGLGALVGALIACMIGVPNKLRMAMIVGFVFFCGGLYMVMMLPSPMWFTILDLGVAYFPMAYIGYWISGKIMP
jgi:hypothetical protein